MQHTTSKASLIAEPRRIIHPGSLKATSVTMAATEIVRSGQCDNLLIIEAHSVEDVSDVVLSLGAIGQSPSRWQQAIIDEIGAAGFPLDVWAVHCLDCHYAGERPYWQGSGSALVVFTLHQMTMPTHDQSK